MSHKYVYEFSEGDGSMPNLLGGKGANLAEMTGLGMPVPQGFTISTEACTRYYADGEKIGDDIREQIVDYIGKLEELTGKKFGDPDNPLLVSVRAGAAVSLQKAEGVAQLFDQRRIRTGLAGQLQQHEGIGVIAMIE